MLVALLQALRPHQWVKNLLLFAPLVFAHRVDDPASWVRALLGFAVFCMAASGIYLLNDVVDRESDRVHPTKCRRPIAAGRLPVAIAVAVGIALLGGSMGLAWSLSEAHHEIPWIAWPATYVLQNVAYSAGLKRVAILDAMVIAIGFMLRVHAGAEVLPPIGTRVVESSSWILMCTFFFSLFLAFCKRRDEVAKVQDATSGTTRASLRRYDLAFLDQVVPSLAALSILSYALWTVSNDTIVVHNTRNLLLTVPFVVFGVFRYLHLVLRGGGGEDPARLLFRDPGLLVSGVLYALAVWLIL